MISKNFPRSKELSVLVITLFFFGCEKPKLKTEKKTEPADQSIAKESQKTYEEKREGVIGRTFATLTLGSRKFSGAVVQGITDNEIVIAHTGGVDKVSWSEVSSKVRVLWGFNPSAENSVAVIPEGEAVPEKGPYTKPPLTEPVVSPKPTSTPKEKRMEIARREQMVEAQLLGIQSLESDLARTTQVLNDFKRQLQALRAQQKRPRSKGVIVKRIGGESTLMNQDRSGEIREVEAKMKGQEQFVAQLVKTLQTARKKHQDLKLALDRARDG